jgi:hypothetical protein
LEIVIGQRRGRKPRKKPGKRVPMATQGKCREKLGECRKYWQRGNWKKGKEGMDTRGMQRKMTMQKPWP